MATIVEHVVFDCADPYELARFWSKVVRRPLLDDDRPGDPVAVIEMADGPSLFFQGVPESKSVKNRVHICLCPDVPRDTEVDRVLALGATMYDDHRQPDGSGFAVLTDPEGNEFCVLRSKAERPADHPGG